MAILDDQPRLHAGHERETDFGKPCSYYVRHVAMKSTVVVAPDADCIGFEQQLGDFRGAQRAGERIDGIAEGDDLIDSALAKQSEGTSQFGRVTVDIGD